MTTNLLLVALKLDGVLVANIAPSSGDVTVSPSLTSRFNVTWATGHITLIIFNVTTSAEGVYSCELSVPGILWKSSIKVAVVGKMFHVLCPTLQLSCIVFVWHYVLLTR